MSDITRILSQIDQGDPQAANELLPLVYDELRKLAASRLANEKPGQTLQATALVHEAYVRLVGAPASGGREPAEAPAFDNRATSSPPRLRRCGEYLSKMPAAKAGSGVVAIVSG